MKKSLFYLAALFWQRRLQSPIFYKMEFPSVSSIASSSIRFDSPSSFFGEMPLSWSLAVGQIAKVETRQFYREPGNPSWEAMERGNFDEAIRLIPESKAGDMPLFEGIRDRKVDFVRCRPLAFPLTTYMRWEMAVYNTNIEMGERIFACNLLSMSEFFEKIVTHDFMIFDSRRACIHDYDESGLIQGGWWVDDHKAILTLLSIFSFLKSNCQDIAHFTTN